MTTTTTTGGAPFVVGLGGTLRANSSTERALRYCLTSVERQGGRTRYFSRPELDLPMYAPHELERTPKALELVSAHVQAFLAAQGRELVVGDAAELDDDLVRDITEILTGMCVRLYGERAAANCGQWAVAAAADAGDREVA